MKKQLLYSILAVLIMSGTVFGATYAFFSASVGNSVSQTNSSDMDIVYSGGSPITGTMQQVANRSGGFSTVINIKTASNSVEPKVNMFINSLICNGRYNLQKPFYRDGEKRNAIIAAMSKPTKDGFWELQRDYVLASPSTAASYCSGRSCNGWLHWVNDAGQSLDELYRSE